VPAALARQENAKKARLMPSSPNKTRSRGPRSLVVMEKARAPHRAMCASVILERKSAAVVA
jgi:hypothetical protein